jgi:hypothetical protein
VQARAALVRVHAPRGTTLSFCNRRSAAAAHASYHSSFFIAAFVSLFELLKAFARRSV